MWYKFKEDDPIGIPRIDHYHVAFYDMKRNGSCFDESFFKPEEIDKVMPYVETVEDVGNNDRTRVFVCFDDGDRYELKLVKLNDEQKYSGNFYG